MKQAIILSALIGAALVGCSGDADVSVSKSEEELFKNPPPVDRSKIPKNPMPKGPSYIGAPSSGSGSGAPPPAAAGATAGG